MSSVRQGGFEGFLPSPRLQFRYRQKFVGPSLRVLDHLLFRVCQTYELGAGALIWVYEECSFKLCGCERLC